MTKGGQVSVSAEIVEEQGEPVGRIGSPQGQFVYYFGGQMLLCEQGASRKVVYVFLGNPLELYHGSDTIRDILGLYNKQ